MKKILLSFLVLVFLFNSFSFVNAQSVEDTVEVVFFFGQNCPHCAAEKVFLKSLAEKYLQVEVSEYELSENIDLIREYYHDYKIPFGEQGLVPLTFVAKEYFVGFSEQIGQEIERAIEMSLSGKSKTTIPGIKIPFFGEINPASVPIPLLAVILGLLDGFNICSLGALVLILSLVLALRSKKKILTFGGIFILTTVIIYGLLVFLWHQLFVFIAPSIKKIELFIGFFALIGAFYFLREFIKNKRGKAVCKFAGISEKFSNKLQDLFKRKAGIIALSGAVLLFAAIVTVIEFPCTAFFPVLFAGILTEANVSFSLALFYIFIYILLYMLDEILVLVIAAFTFKIWIASPKSIMYLNLFTSFLLFILSFYYLLN